MAVLPIDISGRKGLSKRYFGNYDQIAQQNNKKFLGDPGEMVDGYWNPFRRAGVLAPSVDQFVSQTFSGGSGTLDANAGSCIYDIVNSDYYFAERGRQIWKGDGLDDIQFTNVVDLGASGTPTIHDLEIYQINGTRKLFFIYETGGNLAAGISPLPYDSASDDPAWLNTTTTGAFTNALSSQYAFMRVADNGFAYIFADNTVHKVDGTTNGGTNGTVSANTLLFPPFFSIVDALDYRGLMFIGIHQTTMDSFAALGASMHGTPCGVYIWDRLSSVVQTRDYVPIEGVLAIKKIYVAPTGALRMICISSIGFPQIREYDGSTFRPIRELDLGAAPTFPDGLTVTGLSTFWIGCNGTFYGHGQTAPGEPEILAKIGQFKAASATNPTGNVVTGALMFGGESTYSGSSGWRTERQTFTFAYSSSGNFIKKYSPFDMNTINDVNQTPLQGDVFTPVIPLPVLSTAKSLEVYMARSDAASGSTVAATIKIYFNGSTTAWASKTILRSDIAKGYAHFEINLPYVMSIQLEIEFTTAVSAIHDNTDFQGYAAVLNYDPLTDVVVKSG